MKDKDCTIERQWAASTVSWHEDQLVLSCEMDYPGEIIAVDKMMHDLVRSNETLFKVERCEKLKRSMLQISELGRRFLNCLQVDAYTICNTFNHHKLSPYFTLFAKQVAEHKYPSPRSLTIDSVGAFNEWVGTIRDEARADGFAQSVDRQERAMRKNAASLLQYLRRLHEICAKLVVVRLDVGYSKQFRTDEEEADVNPAEVKRHLKELLKYLRKNFPTLVGYVWKVEFGSIKSYHVHLMLIFNGHDIREDATVGQIIGERWSKEITSGTGTYWNCNARKDHYAKLGLLGIGTIKYNDMDLRANLEKAALYLAKVDWYVRLNAPGIGRTFGKGMLPDQIEPRRGRPRSSRSYDSQLSGRL